MKKIILLLILVLTITFAKAQDNYNNNKIETLFSKDLSNGGYGAVSLGFSNIDGRNAFISGVRGAFVFDHTLAIGLGGYGFRNNTDYHVYLGKDRLDYSLVGGYGGFFIEPIVGGRRPVHVSFPVLFAIGGASLIEYFEANSLDHSRPLYEYEYDFFFVIEPAVELEFNLTRFFRTAATISYRHTLSFDMIEADDNALRGLNIGLIFKLGKF